MNGSGEPALGPNLNPLTRLTELFGPILTDRAWTPLAAVTTRGKLAEVFGVFVPPCTCKVIPFVLGIETVLVHVTVPVQVNKTVSPSFAEEIAELIVAAEQSV